jgi:hypothetical protein
MSRQLQTIVLLEASHFLRIIDCHLFDEAQRIPAVQGVHAFETRVSILNVANLFKLARPESMGLGGDDSSDARNHRSATTPWWWED